LPGAATEQGHTAMAIGDLALRAKESFLQRGLLPHRCGCRALACARCCGRCRVVAVACARAVRCHALADVLLSSTLARRATTRLSASTPATPRTHPPPRHARLA